MPSFPAANHNPRPPTRCGGWPGAACDVIAVATRAVTGDAPTTADEAERDLT